MIKGVILRFNNTATVFPMAKNGFTLIEVLIFTALISVIFVVLSYLSIASLFQTKVARHKVFAAHYAEELREWLRGRKEVDWSVFKTTYANNSNFCFNDSPIPNTDAGNGFACVGNNCVSDAACAFNPANSPLPLGKRYVNFVHNVSGTDNVQINIIVSWSEGDNSYSVPVNTIFSAFE